MPMQDFVDVRVHVDGQPLREYRVEGEDDTDQRKTRYIGVKVGQKIEVIVRVMKHFALMWAPYLYASLKIDDSKNSYWHTLESRDLAHKHGHLVDNHVRTFAEQYGWDDETGEWMSYEQRFGPLGTADNDELLANVSPEAFAGMGSIRVTFYRAKKVHLDEKISPLVYADKSKDIVPERYLKGRDDIKANIKLVPTTPRPPPDLTPRSYDYIPIKKPGGLKYEFVFYYRTRKALQHLGVIERSPSPPPSLLERAERAEARLARLEAEFLGNHADTKIKIKAEVLDHRADTNVKIKPDPDKPAAKRPFPYSTTYGSNDDDVEEMTPPPRKKPRLVIDLTDDD